MLTAAGQSVVHEAAALIHERERRLDRPVDIRTGATVDAPIAFGYWTRLDIPFMTSEDVAFRLMISGIMQANMLLCATSMRYPTLPRHVQKALLLFTYYGGLDAVADDVHFGVVIDRGAHDDIFAAISQRYEKYTIPHHVREWISELSSESVERSAS